MIYQVGPHRVRHGDINDPELESFLGATKADIFYTDPPWGEGNIKYWNTMNRKMNSDVIPVPPIQLRPFLDRVLSLAAAYTRGWVVVEYGKRWTEVVKTQAQKHGLHHCGTVECLYGSTNLPLDLLVFNTSGVQPINLSSVYHQKGYKCVKAVFQLLTPSGGAGVGMDLCCGLGYTARACVDSGLTFMGNELNLARLQETLKALRKGVKE